MSSSTSRPRSWKKSHPATAKPITVHTASIIARGSHDGMPVLSGWVMGALARRLPPRGRKGALPPRLSDRPAVPRAVGPPGPASGAGPAPAGRAAEDMLPAPAVNSLRRRGPAGRAGSAPGGSVVQGEPALVPRGPLAHPLGIPDDLDIVDGNRQIPRHLADHVGRSDPAPGPLAVVRDAHRGGPGGERLRFDVELHARPRPGEIDQRLDVGVLGRAVEAGLAAPPRSAESEPVSPSHVRCAPVRAVVPPYGVGCRARALAKESIRPKRRDFSHFPYAGVTALLRSVPDRGEGVACRDSVDVGGRDGAALPRGGASGAGRRGGAAAAAGRRGGHRADPRGAAVGPARAARGRRVPPGMAG